MAERVELNEPPPLPDEAGIAARLAALPERGARQLERLTAAAPDLDRRQSDIARRSLHENRSTRSRLRLAIQLVDELGRVLAAPAGEGSDEPLAACRPGCAHCCHIRVEMTQLEAEQLGAAIGRRPHTQHRYHGAEPDAYDYATPCPFLVAGDAPGRGRCSIYEQRPFACRKHHSIDVDALFCRLDMPHREAVGQVSMDAALVVYGSAMTGSMGVVDIRDWFPGPAELARGPVGRIETARQLVERMADPGARDVPVSSVRRAS